MKKLFLLVAFSMVIMQQVIAAPIWANQWNVLKFRAILGIEQEEAVIYEYTLSADTIINGITYTQVMEQETLTANDKKYVAAIRQEQDKMYVRYDNIEYLLYDFGAKVGDEIMAWGGLDHPTTLCKNTIKDVQITENGKRILTVEIREDSHIEPLDYTEAQWIEGIGSTSGLLHSGVTYPGGFFHYLQCAYSNGEQVFERNDSFAQFGCEYNNTITAISNNLADPSTGTTKRICNGQIVIDRNGKVYTLMGVEIMR